MQYFINKEYISNNSLLYYYDSVGHVQVNSTHDIKRNNFPGNIVHIVTSGQGTIIYKNQKHDIKKGDMFIFNAYEPHRYFANKTNPYKVKWIVIMGGDSLKIFNWLVDRFNLANDERTVESVGKKIDLIISMVKKNDKDKYRISQIIYQLLLDLVGYGSNINYNNNAGKFITEIDKYISKNLNKKITVKELSQFMNYNESYFIRYFKKTLGTTPYQYIIEKKIVASKELMSFTHKTISEISDDLSFLNASHFIRVFKNSVGLTPNHYRKSIV